MSECRPNVPGLHFITVEEFAQLARVSRATTDDFARHLSEFGYRPHQIEADGSTTPLETLPDVPVVTVAFIHRDGALKGHA